jgi:hypothetical protein
MTNETTNDNRHCWFCGQTQPGTYLHDATEWLCLVCGTVEDLDEWPARGQAFQAWVDKSLNDPDYLDRLARHLKSPVWKEPLANPKPLTELHAADLHDGYYPMLDDEPEDQR